MSKKDKLFEKLANFKSDKTWSLADAEQLLALMGFALDRHSGSHRSYVHPTYPHNLGLCPHGKKGILPAYIRAIRAALAAVEQQTQDP